MSTIADGGTTGGAFEGLKQVFSPWLTSGAAVGTLLVCIAYAALVVWARWVMIARPARKLLLARIDDDIAAAAARMTEENAALREAKNLLAKARADLSAGFLSSLGWSGADEMAGFRHVFAAERTLLWVWPAERVRVQLLEARDRLVEIFGPEAAKGKLVQAIDAAENESPPNDVRCRALLDEALGIIRAEAQRTTFSLYTWQNKTMLMVGVALLLIVVIAGSLGKPAFLLVGAIGGFLSRLSRVMRSSRAPSDHATYWTTIFLSPLVGALSGWAGILIVSFGVEVEILSGPFKIVAGSNQWSSPGLLGLALLFGFSERYLDTIVDDIEGPAKARSGPLSAPKQATAQAQAAQSAAPLPSMAAAPAPPSLPPTTAAPAPSTPPPAMTASAPPPSTPQPSPAPAP